MTRAPVTEETALVPTNDENPTGEGHNHPTLHHQNSHVKNLGEDVPLYARARQRQRWDDEQILPHVNWGDLFFDLFYVAAAYNLAIIMKQSISAEGLLYFACCYMPIVVIWYEKMGWDARYAPEDNLFHRFSEVIHHVILGIAIQHIRPVEIMKYTCDHPTTLVFLSALSIVFLMHTGEYVDLALRVDGGPEAVAHSLSDTQRKVAGSIPVWIATFLAARDWFRNENADSQICQDGNRLPVIIGGLSFFTEQAFVMVSNHVLFFVQHKRHKEIRVPMNLEFTIHRLGEWVMLMLGESVLSLIIVEESPGRRYFVTSGTGIVAVTMMQYLYFRTNPASADDHAMRRSMAGGLQFFYSLVVYSACLILMGCSFKLILHQYLDEYEKKAGEDEDELADSAHRITNMFSWSLAGAFFFMDLMLVSHRGWKLNLGRMIHGGRIRWGPTLCTAGLVFFYVLTASLPYFVSNLEVLSVAGCAIVLLQVLLRTLGFRYFPVSKRAMEDLYRWPNVTEARSIAHN